VRVILTPQAIAQLKEIEDYISADSPTRAQAFVAAIRARIRKIGHMPQAFALAPRYEQFGIRRRPYGDYLIFYRIETRLVRVIAIIHGARDYDRVLSRNI
jgi:plasmid stabilization system protein ParE